MLLDHGIRHRPLPKNYGDYMDGSCMVLTVTPLHCGIVHLDKSILTAGVDHGEVTLAPSIVLLIEAPETILVDTAFGDPDHLSTLHYPCERGADQSFEAARDRRCLTARDIDTVVLTCLH